MKTSLVSANITMFWPLLIVLVGLVLYWVCTPNPVKPKLARLGEMTFFAGMLALSFALIGHLFNF